MSDTEKYIKAFTSSFNVKPKDVKNLKYESIDEWNSVGHMSLISAIEKNFNIMLESSDIISFNSYEKGKEILKKYNINI